MASFTYRRTMSAIGSAAASPSRAAFFCARSRALSQAKVSMVMSATSDSTPCWSFSDMPNFWAAMPSVARMTFFMPATCWASASRKPGSCGSTNDGMPVTSSATARAACRKASSPFSAFFMIMPGTSMRLISLVPSKMRLMRSSR